MLCGLSPRNIRRLCDNVFDGGLGFSPREVGDMTLDQAFMLLVDKENLRLGDQRSVKCESVSVAALVADKDGYIKGRSEDGTLIKAKIGGKSLASRLREEAQARRDAEKKKQDEDKKNKRKNRRGR